MATWTNMRSPSYPKSKYSIFLAAGLSGLFTVVNVAFAQNWTATSTPLNTTWRGVSISADGIKLVAAGVRVFCCIGYGPIPIYVSSDSGTSWTPTTSPSNYWNLVACSADGRCIAALLPRPAVVIESIDRDK